MDRARRDLQLEQVLGAEHRPCVGEHDLAVGFDEQAPFLGLGIGTLIAYGEEGQTWDFYEIDPVVIHLAREKFSTERVKPSA